MSLEEVSFRDFTQPIPQPSIPMQGVVSSTTSQARFRPRLVRGCRTGWGKIIQKYQYCFSGGGMGKLCITFPKKGMQILMSSTLAGTGTKLEWRLLLLEKEQFLATQCNHLFGAQEGTETVRYSVRIFISFRDRDTPRGPQGWKAPE